MNIVRPLVRFTGVHGTWHRHAPWLRHDSPFLAFLAEHNVRPLHPKDPFVWSGDLNGWQFWRRWGWGSKDGDLGDWMVAGNALRWKLQGEPYADRGLLVHSHGLWPAIEAMAQGLAVPWMVSVGSPPRYDLEPRIAQALPQLGSWLHIYDVRQDRWGTGGSFGDGHISLTRAQRFAGIHNVQGQTLLYSTLLPRRGGNDAVAGIRHSACLVEPDAFHYWIDRHWLDFMAGRSPEVV